MGYELMNRKAKKRYKQLKRNSGNWREEQTSNKSTSALYCTTSQRQAFCGKELYLCNLQSDTYVQAQTPKSKK